MSNPLHYRLPFAVYSLALDLAVEAHYGTLQSSPKMAHVSCAFLRDEGGVKVDPIFLPVGCECVVDTSATKTIGLATTKPKGGSGVRLTATSRRGRATRPCTQPPSH